MRVSGARSAIDQALFPVLPVLPSPAVIGFSGDPKVTTGLGHIAIRASML